MKTEIFKYKGKRVDNGEFITGQIWDMPLRYGSRLMIYLQDGDEDTADTGWKEVNRDSVEIVAPPPSKEGKSAEEINPLDFLVFVEYNFYPLIDSDSIEDIKWLVSAHSKIFNQDDNREYNRNEIYQLYIEKKGSKSKQFQSTPISQSFKNYLIECLEKRINDELRHAQKQAENPKWAAFDFIGQKERWEREVNRMQKIMSEFLTITTKN